MIKHQRHLFRAVDSTSDRGFARRLIGDLGRCALAVALVACAFLAVSFLAGAMALAADPDAGTLGTTVADSGWSLFETYGPIWGSVALAYALVRHLLAVNESRHWIASGRILAILTGVVAVLSTVIQWHFGGAPASGVFAAAMGSLALIWHPTVPARASSAASSAAFVVVFVVVSGSSSCAGRQSVGAGVSAGLDCEASNIVAFMGDATAFAIRTVEHWISGTGQVDQSGLAADLAKINTDLGRCAADAAVAALAAKAAAPQPGAASAAPMAVDAAQISSTYAQIRSQLGWPSPVRRAAPGGTP